MLHYINYKEAASIDYCFLLALYSIAERNAGERIYNIVRFRSAAELTQKLNTIEHYTISQSKVSRILKNKEYIEYFNYDIDTKTITLYNNFKKAAAKSSKFIVLTDKEKMFLLQQNDNLLCKYYTYIKYNCGRSKSGTTDFTAKQFLQAIGYSCKSGNNISTISGYNSILAAHGFINIQKYRDNNGNERNIYSLQV